MKDDSIVISSRFAIWLAVLPPVLVSMMLLLAGGSFYFREDRAVQDRSLTAFLLAFGGVALLLSMISFGRSYSSAFVRGNILVIRNRGRRFEIPLDQVQQVIPCYLPSRSHPPTIRIVFSDRSPIRDAVLALLWLDDPVDSMEALIDQAKRNAEQYEPYRPA
ncbi:hypothetical protein GC170_07420 [bacterium]|nr:hypothetical protein [bacterium]